MLGICLKGPPGRKGAVEKNILESPNPKNINQGSISIVQFFTGWVGPRFGIAVDIHIVG